MRILQILHDGERGGVQTLAALIEEGLRPDGVVFETAYLYSRPGLSLSPWTKLGCTLAMVRRILRGGFDGLVAYQSTASILAGAIGRLQGCPIRIVHQTCTPSETATPLRLLDKLVGALGLYTFNIANCATTMAEFDRYPLNYRRSMALIEHGIEVPVSTRSRDEIRRHFGLPLTQPILLNVGRLVAQKNQGVLIRVLANVPDAHLVMAGDGINADAYRDLAAELGVTGRLHLLGAVPSAAIGDLYSAADLFVFPSTWETFGLAAAEAAMAGKPMVVADLAVLREVLRTDGTEPVSFVAPFDVEGWTSAIRAALAAPAPSDVLARFSRAVAEKYSLQRMIEAYRDLLEQMPRRSHMEMRRMGIDAKPKEI